MRRKLALAFAVFTFSIGNVRADAATLTWTRLGVLAGAADLAGCHDGRIYVRTDDGGLHLNRDLARGAPWEQFSSVASPGGLTCANNVLYYLSEAKDLFRNDGTATGTLSEFVGRFPGTREIVGGTLSAFFVPAPRFLRLDFDGGVHTTPDPAGTWTRVGTNGSAEHLAVGGGFMDWRAYVKNSDGTVWENAGRGCDPYWRYLASRSTLDELSSITVDRLLALDHDDSIHLGTIRHERRTIEITARQLADFANPLLLGTRLRFHGGSGTFTPSGALAALGLPGFIFPVPEPSFRVWEFGTTYSANDINLSRLTLGLEGPNAVLGATFEEAGLEMTSSNGVFPNINILDFRGRLRLSGRVGRCGQPELATVAAEFDGTAHGIDNVFSFVVTELNGPLRPLVQNALLSGADSLLADPAAPLALGRALLAYAQSRTGGRAWSHVIGPTFSIQGGRIRFEVER